MKEIIEYRLVHIRAPDENIFLQEVNRLIKEGWAPQGGIAYDHSVGTHYIQAMVMYKKEE